MAKNLRKGSKVLVSVSGGILKRTPGIVKSVKNNDVVVRVTSGFAKGKLLARNPKEIKRRSK